MGKTPQKINKKYKNQQLKVIISSTTIFPKSHFAVSRRKQQLLRKSKNQTTSKCGSVQLSFAMDGQFVPRLKTETLPIMRILTHWRFVCNTLKGLCPHCWLSASTFSDLPKKWHSWCKVDVDFSSSGSLNLLEKRYRPGLLLGFLPVAFLPLFFFCHSASRFSRHFGSALDNSQLNDSQPCFLTFLWIIMALAAVSYHCGTELPNGEGRSGKQFTGKKKRQGTIGT